MKVALYIRVSSEEQVKYGYSLSSQEQRLIDYSKSKNYNIVCIYRDEGKSARTKLSNRTELLQMVSDAEKGMFDRIIFWRLDRYFRNVADYYKVQDRLDKCKVDWECTDEDYNTSTAQGRLTLNIKLSIAQNESDTTSERIKFNFNNMINNGLVINGHAPYGYKIQIDHQGKKRLVKDELKKPVVEDLFKHYKESNSLISTAIYLNNKYPTLVYKEGFSSRDIRNFLNNDFYIGKFRNNINYCEPYISKEERDELNKIRKEKNIKAERFHIYLFSSLITISCGHKACGCSKKLKDGSYTYSYCCMNKSSYGSCHLNSFKEEAVENYILKNLENDLKEKHENSNYELIKKEIKENKNNIFSLKKEKERIIVSFNKGWMSEKDAEKEINKIDFEIKKLENSKIQKPSIDYSNILPNDWKKIYNNLSREEKREWYRTFISKIYVDIDKYKQREDFVTIYYL